MFYEVLILGHDLTKTTSVFLLQQFVRVTAFYFVMAFKMRVVTLFRDEVK